MIPFVYVFVSTMCAGSVLEPAFAGVMVYGPAEKCKSDELPIQSIRISTDPVSAINEKRRFLCDFVGHRWGEEEARQEPWDRYASPNTYFVHRCIYCGKCQRKITTEKWEDVR